MNFDPSFCARLVDPTAITVVDSTAMACTSDCSNGGTSCTVSATCTACTTGGCQPRVRAAHLEQPIDCASGTARIAFNNGQGGVAIGKGSGAILELNVGTLTPNASGVFTFTPASIDAPPPTLGQHQEEILGALGYSKDDIKAMREKLAI